MSVKILIFDRSKVSALKLVSRIEHIMDSRNNDITFKIYDPREVFNRRICDDSHIIFFTIINMYDLEAARKIAVFNRNSTLIVISNTEEFGTWSWSLGADYYLLRPVSKKELERALQKSGEFKCGRFESKKVFKKEQDIPS